MIHVLVRSRANGHVALELTKESALQVDAATQEAGPRPEAPPIAGPAGRLSAVPGFVVTAAFLSLFWLGFSDKYDAFHILSGVGSAILVTALTRRLLVSGTKGRPGRKRRISYVWSFQWRRLFIYAPWLVWKVSAANLQVARMVLSPRMPIAPAIIRVKTGLRSDVARLAFAATVTLTPGTCVLDVEDDVFIIHKIHPSSAADILSGAVTEMVRKTFEPEGFEPPEVGPHA